MMIALAIVGYALIGLISARVTYRQRIKSGAHEGFYTEIAKEDTATLSTISFFLWPGWAVVALLLGVVWIVTVKPPKTPRELREERDAMQRRIKQLEQEVLK